MVVLRVPVVLIYDFRYPKRPQRPSIMGTWTLSVRHYKFRALAVSACKSYSQGASAGFGTDGLMPEAPGFAANIILGLNQSRILYKVLLILNSIELTGDQVLPSTWRAGAAFVLRQRSSPPN